MQTRRLRGNKEYEVAVALINWLLRKPPFAILFESSVTVSDFYRVSSMRTEVAREIFAGEGAEQAAKRRDGLLLTLVLSGRFSVRHCGLSVLCVKSQRDSWLTSLPLLFRFGGVVPRRPIRVSQRLESALASR